MAVDITALYCCLDDFCKVFADWEAHRLLPSEQTRQRSGKLSRELWAKVGDGLTGGRRRIVGVFEPPRLQPRSDTPCPMLTWSSCFNQGHLPTRSPRCCATERAPYWLRRSRPRWPNSLPSMSI